jgi:hypothetical protein
VVQLVQCPPNKCESQYPKKKKECKTGHAKGKALMGVGGGVKKVKERNMVDILSVQI